MPPETRSLTRNTSTLCSPPYYPHRPAEPISPQKMQNLESLDYCWQQNPGVGDTVRPAVDISLARAFAPKRDNSLHVTTISDADDRPATPLQMKKTLATMAAPDPGEGDSRSTSINRPNGQRGFPVEPNAKLGLVFSPAPLGVVKLRFGKFSETASTARKDIPPIPLVPGTSAAPNTFRGVYPALYEDIVQPTSPTKRRRAVRENGADTRRQFEYVRERGNGGIHTRHAWNNDGLDE